jgi:hypothetical protein
MKNQTVCINIPFFYQIEELFSFSLLKFSKEYDIILSTFMKAEYLSLLIKGGNYGKI